MVKKEELLKTHICDLIKMILEEFNCNHQADLEDMGSSNQVKIYNREDEHKRIEKFLDERISTGRSGLMYLCGHPGTGKTSSLNYVLGELFK